MVEAELFQEFLDPQRLGLFLVFVGQSCTLAEAARLLKCPRTTLAYHVQRWTKQGLLEVEGDRRKRYTAASQGLYLSFEQVAALQLADTLVQWGNLWQERLLRSGLDSRGPLHGVQFTRTGLEVQAEFATSPADVQDPAAPDQPAVLLGSWITELHLSYQDARLLQQDLLALREKYAGRKGQKYGLQLGLAPLMADG